jgi:hypothetical protein
MYKIRNQNRVAAASLAGYRFQLLHTVRAWLELPDDELLVAEGNEDIDRICLPSRTHVEEQVMSPTRARTSIRTSVPARRSGWSKRCNTLSLRTSESVMSTRCQRPPHSRSTRHRNFRTSLVARGRNLKGEHPVGDLIAPHGAQHDGIIPERPPLDLALHRSM